MTNRRLLCSLLSGLVLISCLPGALAAIESTQKSDALVTRYHDPFIQSMRELLSTRALSEAELQKLSDYIKAHPDDPDGHFVIANAYNRLGMDGMYAEEMEKGWRLSPTSVLYLLAALKARAVTEDRSRYERLVDEAFQTFKNDAGMLEKLGQLFLDNGQTQLAVRFLSQAVDLQPKNLQVRCSYCNCLLAMRRYKELIASTGPLVENEKTLTLANLLRGVAYYNLNLPYRALPLLEKAYIGAPDRPEVAEAYFDCLRRLGKDSQALQPALMALALQPPFAKHMNDLKIKVRPVIAAAGTRELRDGIKYVGRNIPPTRSLAFFYFALGDLLDKSGRIVHASDCFNAGLFLDPSLGRAYMRLARDWELLGCPAEKVEGLYKQAALRAHEDKEVQARYDRALSKRPAESKDIAGKIKLAINKIRYKT